jgi:hypothetical protein
VAKRSTFEDLLNTEFRWPRTGDHPFKVSDDSSMNAYVEESVGTRLVLMTSGYKMGADLMVEQAGNSNSGRAQLVYPIIFNYRHFLELSLKSLLVAFGPSVGVSPNWKSHDLATLWGLFKEMLLGYGDEDPDATNPIVERIIAEFAKIDPNSYAYRYPVDTKGRPIPIGVSELDLDVLKDVMEGVAGYFTGCDGYLDHLQDAGP